MDGTKTSGTWTFTEFDYVYQWKNQIHKYLIE